MLTEYELRRQRSKRIGERGVATRENKRARTREAAERARTRGEREVGREAVEARGERGVRVFWGSIWGLGSGRFVLV